MMNTQRGMFNNSKRHVYPKGPIKICSGRARAFHVKIGPTNTITLRSCSQEVPFEIPTAIGLGLHQLKVSKIAIFTQSKSLSIKTLSAKMISTSKLETGSISTIVLSQGNCSSTRRTSLTSRCTYGKKSGIILWRTT